METVRCVGRVDLTLTGSFADMTLLPTAGATGGNHKADLFVLTNPGQLHLYDGTNLSTLLTEKERKQFAHPVEFPMVIPTADPSMTVAKFSALPTGGISSKCLSEVLCFVINILIIQCHCVPLSFSCLMFSPCCISLHQ